MQHLRETPGEDPVIIDQKSPLFSSRPYWVRGCGFAQPRAANPLIDRHGRPHSERQLRFGRKLDVFLPCRRRAGCSRSGTSRCPDRCALAAACQRSDHGTSRRAAADEPGVPFALAAQRSSGGARCNRVRFAAHGHCVQPEVKFCRRGQAPRSLHAAHRHLDCRTLGNHHFAPEITSCATEPVTFCPALAVFELTDWSVTTVIFVPSGTVPAAWTRAGNTSTSARKIEANRIRDFMSVTSRQNLGPQEKSS